MSRTRHKEKAKRKGSQHCTMVGCDICEAIRISQEQNRAFKQKKRQGIDRLITDINKEQA